MSSRRAADDVRSPAFAAPTAAEFQRQWQGGQQPQIESFLSQRSAIPLSELAAVLRVDLRQRLRRGEQVAVGDYLSRFPQLLADATLVVDLIYTEFLVREELGERAHMPLLQAQFPQHAAELAAQVELHRALENLDAVEAGDTSPPQQTIGAGPRLRRLPSLGPGYEVLAEIGRGGMGVVYRARQVGLNRLVALKMVRGAEFASAEVLARFRAEAEAVARLHHPQIVQVYDYGEHDGLPYLALELVSGGTLAARLDGSPWPARRASALIETLARAADFAHQRGVIHRDLKPANVLLVADSPEIQVKITDFGLAKAFRENCSEQTQSGELLGTPSYMAPEQAAGQARQIGPAADVYALGAILYELLTGRPPFRGETPLVTLQQVLTKEPTALRLLAPGVPRDLATICEKCLRREPELRYRSAADLADDLGRLLADQPIRARPTGSIELAWRWCRRNPSLTLLGGTVALLLLVVVVLSTASPGRSSVPLQVFGRSADSILRWSDLDLQTRAEVSASACSQLPQALHPSLGSVQSLDISPDGRLLAVSRAQGLELWDLKTERYWVQTAIVASKIKFTENGDLIVSSLNSITRWPRRIQPSTSAEAESDLKITFGPPRLLAGATDQGFFAIDPSGDRLLMMPVYYGCRVIDIDEPAEVVRLRTKFDINRMAISTNRTWAVLTNRSADGAAVFNALTGDLAAELEISNDGLPIFSPDNQWLALSSVGVRVWRVNDWRLTTDFHVPVRTRNSQEIAFSPDSRMLAIGQPSGIIRLTDPATGVDWATLTDPAKNPGSFLVFSPNQSRLIAIAAGEQAAPRIWNLAVMRERLTQRGLEWPEGVLPVKASAQPSDDSSRLAVTFDIGNFPEKAKAWALVLKALGLSTDRKQAVTLLEQAIQTDPQCGKAHNDLAWTLVIGPEALRDPDRAIEHARRAVALEPGHQAYLNTLGFALYRAARYEEAIPVLERALELSEENLAPLNRLFLALTHACKGDAKTAQEYYTQVKAWYDPRGGIPSAYQEEVSRILDNSSTAIRP